MSAYAAVIELFLSYSVTDWEVSHTDEENIISVFRIDPNASLTISTLVKKKLLNKLFSSVDSNNNRSELVQTLSSKVSISVYPLIVAALSDYPEEKTLFDRCFELHRSLSPYGVVPPPPVIALNQLVSKNPRRPFTGSGATGVSPTVHSMSVRDQARLAIQKLNIKNYPNLTASYSNPIPGSLTDYLARLTTIERKSQAVLILQRKIVSVYQTSYLGQLPTRSQVINAAAKMHQLEPALIAGFILAEQRDQSQNEDNKDYSAAVSIMKGNTSIGLGQVVVSTARKNDLFSGLFTSKISKVLSHDQIALFLSSDEFNIFAVAKFIRMTADKASLRLPSSLPNTVLTYPSINFPVFALHSSHWPSDNIKALASEYTSRAWDDKIFSNWADFVFEAYIDILKSKVFK